jgi:exopolyphosphatase/guanosine-5'-triphosphate,3'-diphosphate pyrophosphatase
MSDEPHAPNSPPPSRDDRAMSGDASQKRPASKNQSRHHKTQNGRRLYAALDLGTNNCRLLIVERDGGNGFRVRDGFSRIVRLGEGLERTGKLSEDAMARTIAALRICAGKIRRAGISRMRCVATEACRGADNGDAFIKRVKRETGLRLEIIDGKAEAELAAIGCGSLFNPDVDDIILFDIGGGSTEVSRMSRQENNFFKLVDSDSLPLGVVRLAERHAGEGPYEHGYEGMLNESEERLQNFMNRQSDITDMSRLQIIGTSGTVTTLAAVQLGLAKYDRNVVDGCTIAAKDITRVIGDLRDLSRDELAANPCIGSQRADLVLAGCAVLEAIYRRWPVAAFSVADRGLREGLLLRMIRSDGRRGGRNSSRNRNRNRNGNRNRNRNNQSRRAPSGENNGQEL